MASGSFKSSTTSNGKYMSIEWRSTANASTRTSTFTAKMVFHGSIQGNALEGSNFTVNGTRYSIEGWWDSYASGNPLTFKEVTITVNHDSNGNASVPVSAYILYNSASWSDLSASGTAVLDNIGTSVKVPSAPTNVTLTGTFDNRYTTKGTWNAVSGATAYEVQRRFWTKYDNRYTDYGNVASNLGTNSITISHSAVKDHCQQIRVRAKNSAGVSAWVESNWVWHQGLKVYNGSSFIVPTIKVWTGSSWKQGYISYYNGSGWETTN